jgi:hypothetical protein
VREELASRLVADVAGGDGHRADAEGMARARGLDRVLHEDDRVVVGERDAAAAQLLRRPCDDLRRRLIREGVDLARLADVPVLAEPTAQVAAGGTEGEDRGPGQEMVQRLLLDGVDAEAARTAEGREHDLFTLAGPDEAQAALSVRQLTPARAHVALELAVVECVPVARADDAVAQRVDAHGSSLAGAPPPRTPV